MPQQRNIEIKVGIFVLICLLAITGMILRFGKYTRFAEKTYSISVVFPNVGGLVRDANVMYAGIPVGKVRDISFAGEAALKAEVTLAIYEGYTIRKDAKFVINQAGLLGDRYVDVIPQSATADLIQPGDVLEGAPSVDLTEAIRSVIDVLHQAAGTIERVDEAIKRVDDTVLSTQSLGHVAATFANVDATTSNAVAIAAELRSVIAESRESVTNTLGKLFSASETLDATSRRVDALVSSNQDDIRAAVKNLTASTERLNDVLTRLDKGEGTVGKLLVDPTLHDELVQLVQNWRRFGIMYKDRSVRPAKTDETGGGKPPKPARLAETEGEGISFGTDLASPHQ